MVLQGLSFFHIIYYQIYLQLLRCINQYVWKQTRLEPTKAPPSCALSWSLNPSKSWEMHQAAHYVLPCLVQISTPALYLFHSWGALQSPGSWLIHSEGSWSVYSIDYWTEACCAREILGLPPEVLHTDSFRWAKDNGRLLGVFLLSQGKILTDLWEVMLYS